MGPADGAETLAPGARGEGYTPPLVFGRSIIEVNADSSAGPQETGGDGRGETPPVAGVRPLLVVRSGDVRCGIPVHRLREVVRLGRVTRIPEAKPPFRGLLSLRGEVVTVLDLAALREMAASRVAGGRASRAGETTGVTTGSIRPQRIDSVVVLRGGRDPLGLEVDGVEEIRDLPPVEGDDAPSAPGSWVAGGLWSDVVRDGMGEIGVMDADAVLEAAAALAREGTDPVTLEVGNHG